ncbi:E3 ubiquitin-protein ligase RNF170-like isoform 1-T4 [Ara ararauna]
MCCQYRIISCFFAPIHRPNSQSLNVFKVSTGTCIQLTCFQPLHMVAYLSSQNCYQMATQQHSVFPFLEQHKLCFCRLAHESLQIWQPCKHSDFSCPICLQTATLPVETNCGHLFCGSCLITYWKHSPWLAAIICPLCRQKVVLLDSISCEKKHDKPSKQIVHDIRDYNKRFSGQPRPFADYLYDMPLFLTLALRGIFTWGVLVWLFFLRVAVCSFGTIVCLSSPFDMKPGPLCRTLGTADDMVVVSLLLICMINICQQIAPNGVNMARSAAQSMLSEA